MNEPFPDELTPAGRKRRDDILADVLAASNRRRRRRRQTRIALAIGAAALLAGGVPFVMRDGQQDRIARPEPRPEQVRPDQNPSQEPRREDPSPSILVESISDEMLLAQLDEAQLPYLQTGDGEIRLIATDYDPWVLFEPVTER